MPTAPIATPPDKSKVDIERARNLTLIFSAMLGVAAIVAMIAGRDRLILLVIPIAIIASVGAIVLRDPLFEKRRWALSLAFPIIVWTLSVWMNG
jgi:hypothetical protein